MRTTKDFHVADVKQSKTAINSPVSSTSERSRLNRKIFHSGIMQFHLSDNFIHIIYFPYFYIFFNKSKDPGNSLKAFKIKQYKNLTQCNTNSEHKAILNNQ